MNDVRLEAAPPNVIFIRAVFLGSGAVGFILGIVVLFAGPVYDPKLTPLQTVVTVLAMGLVSLPCRF